jgi:hypothetical protein
MSDATTIEETDAERDVRHGDKLNVYDFGRALLARNDLDPVYVVVWEAMKPGQTDGGLGGDRLRLWLLAYWCFYHVGTASWCANHAREDTFWTRMAEAAGSKTYPRSAERRHFRGDNAAKSVKWLREQGVQKLFEPFDAISTDTADAFATAADVCKYVQTWVGFGPWISFKVADMLERLGLARVRFDIDTVMYDSPREAAELLWRVEHPGEGRRSPTRDEGEWAIGRILGHLASPPLPSEPHRKVYQQKPLSALPKMSKSAADNAVIDQFRGMLAGYAPPRYERPLNAQEAETILCKWKSYVGGHYHVGEDVAAVRRGLLRFAKCRTSQALLKGGKAGGLW